MWFVCYEWFVLVQKKIFIALTIEAVFFAVVVVVTLIALPSHHGRSMLVGMISIVFNIIMYISPLSVMVRLNHFVNT